VAKFENERKEVILKMVTKEHFCPEYRNLQRELAAAQKVNLYPRGKPSATGYSGFCDNENLTGGSSDLFHGSPISSDEAEILSKRVARVREQLYTHRQSCGACKAHFGL